MQKRQLKKNIYHYTAVFEEDTDVGGYSASIPSLPGCISEGDTFEEALYNIQEAAELYLAVMAQQKNTILFKKESRVIVAPLQVMA